MPRDVGYFALTMIIVCVLIYQVVEQSPKEVKFRSWSGVFLKAYHPVDMKGRVNKYRISIDLRVDTKKRTVGHLYKKDELASRLARLSSTDIVSGTSVYNGIFGTRIIQFSVNDQEWFDERHLDWQEISDDERVWFRYYYYTAVTIIVSFASLLLWIKNRPPGGYVDSENVDSSAVDKKEKVRLSAIIISQGEDHTYRYECSISPRDNGFLYVMTTTCVDDEVSSELTARETETEKLIFANMRDIEKYLARNTKFRLGDFKPDKG